MDLGLELHLVFATKLLRKSLKLLADILLLAPLASGRPADGEHDAKGDRRD